MNLLIALALAARCFLAQATQIESARASTRPTQLGHERGRAAFNEHFVEREGQACGFGDGRLAPAWAAYAEIHRAGRQALARGEPRPVLLWHCRSGEDCRGNGDQVKGLITAFYLAAATSRVLLVDWSRNGYNITRLFTPRYIDTALPPGVLTACARHRDVSWWAASAPRSPVAALRAMREPCVFLQSNLLPEKLVLEEPGLLRPAENMWGCAFNFMFQRSEPLLSLLATHVPPHALAPEQTVVGVHLRFGDLTWGRHAYNMQPGEQAVASALRCAARFGRTLLERPGDPWKVLLVTDNLEMKRLSSDPLWVARVMGPGLGRGPPEVFTTTGSTGAIRAPAHTNFLKDAGNSPEIQESILDAWADQLHLAAADGVLATQGSFAVTAADIGLLPRRAVWLFDDATGFCGVHPGHERIVSSRS